MRTADFWELDRVERKRLPLLQELVQCCDEGLLVRVVIDEHAERAEGRTSAKRRRAMGKRLSKTIAVMRDLHVNKKANRGRVILPEEQFVLHAPTGLVERRLRASLVSLDEVLALAQGSCVDAPASSARPATGAGCESDEERPVRMPYTLDRWEDVLASRVWLADLRCCRERYLVLASALWEMTYYGFEYERVVAGQMRARAERMAGAPEGGSAACAALAAQGPSVRAKAFGLAEPDRFEGDYRERMAERVADLNRAAQADFSARCRDLAQRLEPGR